MALQSDAELQQDPALLQIGRRASTAQGDSFIGVRMGSIFALAKEFVDLPLKDIETLLDERHPRIAGRRADR